MDYKQDIRDHLKKSDFEELEAIAESLRKQKARFDDGLWKLDAFYGGMSPARKQPFEEWDKYEKLLLEWLKKSGDSSPTPHVALAEFYISKAWKYRGSGLIHTVGRSSRNRYIEYLEKAKNILNDNKKIAKTCIHWHNAMQAVALGHGWPAEKYDRLYYEAIGIEPEYYSYYFSRALYYQSKWYGNKNKLKSHINESVKNTLDKMGYTLYARLYWSAQREYNGYLFHPGNAEWDKMKSGFKYINNEYPNSPWNKNAFAHFACMAGDTEIINQILPNLIMKEQVNLDAWWSFDEVKYCINRYITAKK